MTGLQESAPGPGTTGPRTREGKAIACLNNLKHGLTGAFRMMEFESQSDFDAACRLWCRTQLLQNKPLTAGDDQRSPYIYALPAHQRPWLPSLSQRPASHLYR